MRKVFRQVITGFVWSRRDGGDIVVFIYLFIFTLNWRKWEKDSLHSALKARAEEKKTLGKIPKSTGGKCRHRDTAFQRLGSRNFTLTYSLQNKNTSGIILNAHDWELYESCSLQNFLISAGTSSLLTYFTEVKISVQWCWNNRLVRAYN